jgi:SAM-dependent methyltransferase
VGGPDRLAHVGLTAAAHRMDDAEFVDRAYALVLRRAPDAEGRATALRALGDGAVSRAAFVEGLVASAEFDDLRALDDALLAARRGPLRGLGAPAGTDERRIEIPWVLSRYRGERRVLDVGYANAPAAYLEALTALGAQEVVGVDLAEERRDIPGLRPVTADVRALPFADGAFDLVHCISTIEHVGWDNSVYGQAAERDDAGMERALRELRRVLAPDGRLLVTVPTGLDEHHGWFVQRPASAWIDLFVRAGLRALEHEIYELGTGGWGSVTGEPPVRYQERGPAASAVLCVELAANVALRR